MNLDLEGRVCVVAGDTCGIGAATARMLAQEGARVLSAAGQDADIELDLTAPDAGERLLETCPEPPWALVSIPAAGQAPAPQVVTEADWQEGWEQQVMAPMRLMRAVAPAMADAGGGRLVNVSSAYGAMRAAELSLSRLFAETFAARGVLVNSGAAGEAEDQAAAVIAFLCSDRASNVTGAVWAADGGTVSSV